MCPGSAVASVAEEPRRDRAQVRVGRCPASGLRPVSMIVVPMPWSSFWLFRLRTIARRCICFAVCGSSSQMCVPGTEVGIALNGPPVSVLGFGSHDSSWLTPPDEEDDHHPLLRPAPAAAAASR